MAVNKKTVEIDSRVMDNIWGNVEELKREIREEKNKSSLILGFLGTFFFVISSRLTQINSNTLKILMVCAFVLSLLLVFFTIFTGKMYQLNVMDFKNKTWDREVIFQRLMKIQKALQHELKIKVVCNGLNILFVATVTIGFLILIV